MQNELDWFEFETRMRAIVTQIIQPIIKESGETRARLETIQKKSENLTKRLTFLENLTGSANNKTGWIKEIEANLNNLSLEIKLLSTNFAQEIFSVKETTQKSNASVKAVNAKTESYDLQISNLGQQIEKTQNTVQGVNKNVCEYFNKIREDLEFKLKEIEGMTSECTKKSEKSIKKVSDLKHETGENTQTIEKIRGLMREQSMQMIQLIHDKATTEDFMKFVRSVETRLESFSEKLRLEDNKVEEIVRYIDVYLPFDIQVYISDNFYSVLRKKALKAWMRFEDQRRKELQKRLTDFENSNEISEIIKKTLQSIRIFESRKDDVYYKMLRRKAEQEIGTSSEEEIIEQKHKLSAVTLKHEQIPDLGLSIDRELIEDMHMIKKESGKVFQTIEKIQKNQENLKKQISSNSQEFGVHLQVLEENFGKFRKEDFERNNSEIVSLSEKIDDFRHKLKNCYDAILNLSGLASGLVEFALVTNAILDQEEKDKKDITKQHSELHLPPVTTRKHSMPPSDFLSGKGLLLKPQNTMISTPLKYKNVIYTREEMIELIGKVISKAWSEASSKPPFISKQIKLKTTKASKQNLNSTLNLSYSHLKV